MNPPTYTYELMKAFEDKYNKHPKVTLDQAAQVLAEILSIPKDENPWGRENIDAKNSMIDTIHAKVREGFDGKIKPETLEYNEEIIHDEP